MLPHLKNNNTKKTKTRGTEKLKKRQKPADQGIWVELKEQAKRGNSRGTYGRKSKDLTRNLLQKCAVLYQKMV